MSDSYEFLKAQKNAIVKREREKMKDSFRAEIEKEIIAELHETAKRETEQDALGNPYASHLYFAFRKKRDAVLKDANQGVSPCSCGYMPSMSRSGQGIVCKCGDYKPTERRV